MNDDDEEFMIRKKSYTMNPMIIPFRKKTQLIMKFMHKKIIILIILIIKMKI